MVLDGYDAFTIKNVAIAKNTALLELGVSTQLTPQLKLDFGYSGQMGNGYRDNGATLGLSYAF